MMKFPTFKEFVQNPVIAFLIICIITIGVLYYDNKAQTERQIKRLEKEIEILKQDNKELNNKFIKTLETLRNA